ncbi:hypothetical protein LG296_20690 (plasmid) [Ureibacillus chungkukjangi]|uniref:hypothetical protein n=1 Tax=Ureibacillus chungkukjangi TaxID=1202712 RepID=UPI00187D1E0D|nr:hypothetical protein [Ureibacillus chungkukjangi]
MFSIIEIVLTLLFVLVLNGLMLTLLAKIDNHKINRSIVCVHAPISVFLVSILVLSILVPSISSGVVILLMIVSVISKFYVALYLSTFLYLSYLLFKVKQSNISTVS